MIEHNNGSSDTPKTSRLQRDVTVRNCTLSICFNETKEVLLDLIELTGRANGGEGGIRTPGRGLPANGFQDRRIRPLCHLSSACILPRPLPQCKTPESSFYRHSYHYTLASAGKHASSCEIREITKLNRHNANLKKHASSGLQVVHSGSVDSKPLMRQ